MIQAKNLMRMSVPFLNYDSKISELFEDQEVLPKGFVLIGNSKRVHGVLNEGGLLQIFLKFQQNKKQDQLIYFRDFFEPVQYIQEEEDLNSILKKTLTAVGHRIFVLDSSQSVVGYISARDVLPQFMGKRVTLGEVDKFSWESQLYYFENFFDKAPLMMHSVNIYGDIQMANEMLHRVLGYEYPELIGKKLSDLYTQDNLLKAKKGIALILKDGFHQVVQSSMVKKDGKIVVVEIASRVLKNIQGESIGTVTVSRPLDMIVFIEALKMNESHP